MPVAIDLGVILALALALIVSFGFLYLYRGTMKPLLLMFADVLDKVNVNLGWHTIHVFGPVSAFVRWVAAEIDYGISQAVLASEKGVVLLWHGLAKQAEWLGNLLADLAQTIEGKFRWILLAFPPALMLWAAVKAAQQLPKLWHYAQVIASAADAELARLGNGIDRLRHRLEAELARDVARVRARVASLGRDAAGTLARLRRIEKTLTATGTAALVGTALAALGLGWTRCSNVSKVGKKVCGMHSGLLEDLLGGLVLVFGSFSLVEYGVYLQVIADDVAGEVRKFWRADVKLAVSGLGLGDSGLPSGTLKVTGSAVRNPGLGNPGL